MDVSAHTHQRSVLRDRTTAFVKTIEAVRQSCTAYCCTLLTADWLLATAYADSGPDLGIICDDCVQAGREQLRQRMLHYASALRHSAEALQCLATEAVCVTSHTDGKTCAAWAIKDASGP
jgi:hypothetical protein